MSGRYYNAIVSSSIRWLMRCRGDTTWLIMCTGTCNLEPSARLLTALAGIVQPSAASIVVSALSFQLADLWPSSFCVFTGHDPSSSGIGSQCHRLGLPNWLTAVIVRFYIMSGHQLRDNTTRPAAAVESMRVGVVTRPVWTPSSIEDSFSAITCSFDMWMYGDKC